MWGFLHLGYRKPGLHCSQQNGTGWKAEKKAGIEILARKLMGNDAASPDLWLGPCALLMWEGRR